MPEPGRQNRRARLPQREHSRRRQCGSIGRPFRAHGPDNGFFYFSRRRDAVNTVANRLLSVGAFPRWLAISLRIGGNADDALPAELTARIGEAARLAETEIVSANMNRERL